MFHVEQKDLRPWMPGSDQIPCYLTHTNAKTHQIIADNLEKSAMYGGIVEGTGVRYCPSIEDKIVKFSGRDSHHVFIEPEGRDSTLIYPNGISNSLPRDIQRKMVHSIPGLENAEIISWGYAIEYDFVDPTELMATMETKRIKNLFLAGQINGTTGYEEAGAQGLIAGINAHRKVRGEDDFVLKRDEAYIGVLIDDLVTKGTEEPYRMFTSRAEHRLFLRQDNADVRLAKYGHKYGLVSDDMYDRVRKKEQKIKKEIDRLHSITLTPSKLILSKMKDKGFGHIKFNSPITLAQLLKRNGLGYRDVMYMVDESVDLDQEIIEQIEYNIRYEGYLKRQMDELRKLEKMESIRLSENIDYSNVYGLSREEVEKLNAVKPVSLGQASRISGITPAALTNILIYLKRNI